MIVQGEGTHHVYVLCLYDTCKHSAAFVKAWLPFNQKCFYTVCPFSFWKPSLQHSCRGKSSGSVVVMFLRVVQCSWVGVVTSQNHQAQEVKCIFQKELITEFVSEHEVEIKTSQKSTFPSPSSSESTVIACGTPQSRQEWNPVRCSEDTHILEKCISFFFLLPKISQAI